MVREGFKMINYCHEISTDGRGWGGSPLSTIWLLFKMSHITHILFDEKNERGKKIFSTERERGGGGGGGGPLLIKSNENINFFSPPQRKDLK